MITKYDKPSGKFFEVSVQEFLSEVGNGAKTREKALSALIDGEIWQDLNAAYYIKPVRDKMGRTNPA